MPPHQTDRSREGRHRHHQRGFSSRGHPYDGPSIPKHPWVHQNEDTQLVHIVPPDRKPGFTIHPLQMIKYLEFNKKICSGKGRTKRAIPFGFIQFAEMFNSVSAREYKYRFASYDAEAKRWVAPVHRVKPEHIHTRFVDRERYHELITMGLITEGGNVDTIRLKTTLTALNQPHLDNSSKTYFYQRRQDARKERAGRDSDSDESESDFSDEDDISGDDTRRDRSRSPIPGSSNQPPPPPKQPTAARAITREAQTVVPAERVVRNSDSPRSTCNPALLTRSGVDEDVLMKNTDASKATEEFFDFDASQAN